MWSLITRLVFRRLKPAEMVKLVFVTALLWQLMPVPVAVMVSPLIGEALTHVVSLSTNIFVYCVASKVELFT